MLTLTLLMQLAVAAVPAPVRHSWESTHAGTVRWIAGPSATYDAYFTVRGVRQAIRYDAGGRVVETRVVIGSFDLPDPVKRQIVRALRGYHILDTWRVDRGGNAAPQYLVECDNIRIGLTLRYDADGTVVSRESRPVHHRAGESGR